jgi:hypothetical protein
MLDEQQEAQHEAYHKKWHKKKRRAALTTWISGRKALTLTLIGSVGGRQTLTLIGIPNWDQWAEGIQLGLGLDQWAEGKP